MRVFQEGAEEDRGQNVRLGKQNQGVGCSTSFYKEKREWREDRTG
jgi:hypothetical protein